MDQLFRTITVRLSRPRWIDWLVLKINGSIKINRNLMKMNVCVERLYRTLTDDWKCLPVALDPGDVTVRCGPTFIKTRPMYEFRIVFNDKLSYNEAHNTTWHSAGPKRMPNGISRRFSICSANPSLLAISPSLSALDGHPGSIPLHSSALIQNMLTKCWLLKHSWTQKRDIYNLPCFTM